jgi:hypothetical protein
MKKFFVAMVLAGCTMLASAQSTTTSQPAKTPPPPPPQAQQDQQAHPRRVLAKLDGFDLAPGKATANQIGGASRGAGQKLVLYAPHKAKIYTLRPAFAWSGDTTGGYKFHIQDINGTFSWEREVTGTSLTYPSDAPPLEPGVTYQWRVDPVSPLLGPPPPAAMVVVLGATERTQMETELSQIPGEGVDAETARARYFFNQRLWYDALMTCSDLIAKYPNRPDLYEMRAMLYYQLPATESLAQEDLARSN